MLDTDSRKSLLTSLRSLRLKFDYNTEEDDIIYDFYQPCLQVAVKYDRAVGFFRANIYRELGEPLLDFAKEGRKARIVCSPDIPEPDEQAAREGYDLRGRRTLPEKEATLINIMEAMANNPDEKDCLDMLRLLIERENLELYIAARPGGIYHRKIGIFTDAFGDKVVFSGSGNETNRATSSVEDWVNDEDFDVYRSWGTEFEINKAKRKEEHLVKLFSGGSGYTKVRPLNQVEREYLNRFRNHKNYEDCLKGARIRSNRKLFEVNPAIKPYVYQLEAINAWKEAKGIGMLSMATGTGKTITALFAIKESLYQGRLVLILVPSSVLLKQWKEKTIEIYSGIPILLAGGGNNWKTDPLKSIFVAAEGKPRIIISTMDTAASDEFIEFIMQADTPILIADEAHRLGSHTRKKILTVPFREKLGLSATPERLYDEEGTRVLSETFGPNPVYDLPISAKVKISENEEEPIIGYFLSPYEYHYYSVTLTPNEQEEWNRITEDIKKLTPMAISLKEKGEDSLAERIKYLLIMRARIVKKATNKISVATRALKEWYRDGGRWIVYCEDKVQLEAVYKELASSKLGIDLLKYHSEMAPEEKTRALAYFENYPSVIVSIRCLDEGVDIPSADGAIILASSKNPREYIQRRGRVLRKAIGKRKADIVDILVLPEGNEEGITNSIVRGELARAWTFTQTSNNKDISHELWKVCIKYGVNVGLDREEGIEDDEKEED
ncbi:DEAD/DEAH box helicase family protein [bacterium]|nr:DEAD/DEAH box helicase family protein [bacterium]